MGGESVRLGQGQDQGHGQGHIKTKGEKIMKASVKLEVGRGYSFRTVTMIYTGELVEEQEDRFVITKAAWIAETKRWSESLRTGEFNEVEMYPENNYVMVFKGGMLDITTLDKLPTETK